MPTTTNKGFIEPAINDSGWGVTLNTLFNAIDTAFGNTTSVNGLTTGTTTLEVTNANNRSYVSPIIKLFGTLTGNVIISLPAGVGGFWYIYNGCINNPSTNTYTVTFASAGGGTSVVLRQPASNTSTTGYWTALICDGTNIYFQNTLPGAASGSNTQVQFNNNGVLGSSSAFTYATTTATFTATVPIGSNVMTVSTVPSATIALGMTLTVSSGGGFSGAVTITALGTGTGGLGTYTVSQNATGSIANITGASITTLSAPNLSGNFLGTARSATYAGSTTIPTGYLTIPQSTNTTPDSTLNGYHIYTASNVTVTGSGFNVGDCFVIVNSGSTARSITAGASTTIRLAGSTLTGTRTIAGYGQAVVLCVAQTTSPASTTFFVSGQGVS